MDQPIPAPAPTEQTPAPAPVSVPASAHAVSENNFTSFREARGAERQGKPLPPVEPVTTETPAVDAAGKPTTPDPNAAPAPAPEARELSRRQREANDRTQRAVDQATADLRAENARLRAMLPQTPPTPQAPAPTQKDHERFLSMPDAPKLEHYEYDVEKYSAAMGVFIANKLFEERTTQIQQEQARTESDRARSARDTAFHDRIAEVKKTDPAFFESISDEVLSLKPFDRLEPGERPGARNAIAEEILSSEYGPQLMRHLSETAGELARLERLGPTDLFMELGALRAQFRQAATKQPTKTLSTAPTPPTVLGTKPSAPVSDVRAAVSSGDFTGFRETRLRERTANMR